MFSGSCNVTIDGTGRIALPRKLRDDLEKGNIVLAKGADACVWLYTPAEWDVQERALVSTMNRYSSQGRILWQHFIGSKQEVEIDKQGRILIPPTLRDFAGLSKDCLAVGLRDCIEIWAKDRYEAHMEAGKDIIKAGLETMGNIISREKGFE